MSAAWLALHSTNGDYLRRGKLLTLPASDQHMRKAAVTMLRPTARPTDGKIDLVTMLRPMSEILS